ncbi:MAG: hypothetical protein ACKO5N_02690 [Sphingomonadales bacterium]
MILRTLYKIILSMLLLAHLAYGQSYHISFTQNGEVVKIENSVVRLKKEPFVIHVTLDSLDGVFVHCAFDSVVYNGALQRNLPDFQTIGWKVSVETEFNKDNELLIQGQESYCYWFYDPKDYDWHRFDANVYVSGSQVKATKTVRQFFDLILNETRPLQAMNKPVYLTFFSISGSFKDESAKLAQVEAYRLIFED